VSLFGLWKPKCPLGLREKAWVEMRLRWLGEQFSVERLARAQVVMPTDDYFPEDYDGTLEAARVLLDRVCVLLGIPPAAVAINVLLDPSDVDAGPHKSCSSDHSCPSCESHERAKPDEPNGPYTIDLDEHQICDPFVLVAILGHALVGYLLGQRKLLEDQPDHQWVVDLATVFFGLGVFTANTKRVETYHLTRRGAAVNRLSFLPSRMTGYALAILAWLRGESKPAWAESLRHDAANAFHGGLYYIERTDDSLLRPDNLHNCDRNPSLRKLLAQLEEGSGSAAVAALWELAGRGAAAGEAAEAVAHHLTDRRPAIRAEAARTLAEFGRAAETAIPPLVDAIEDGEEEVRAAAAYAVGRLHAQPDIVVPMLIDRLEERDAIETVAWALAQFGPAAAPALPRLAAVLRSQLGCCAGAIDYLVYAVRAISSDPEAELKQLIASCDADLQLQADHLLPEPGAIPIPPGGRGWWFWADGPT
jgi:hypothetical protein